ncbi:hypothetical protein [Gordonia aquimaris]|uniref:Uncharacterized protein n=1 Tax=Gordonia aquimaris TaxID=2984863 RepID=A0A9X3D8T5_9ACTN|nr:hypothetical protein [Gordonia aquimaris]MCX2965806.1 hypothetical protein [Gordonia aquimaris]
MISADEIGADGEDPIESGCQGALSGDKRRHPRRIVGRTLGLTQELDWCGLDQRVGEGLDGKGELGHRADAVGRVVDVSVGIE